MPTIGTFKYDNLFAGNAEVVTDAVTLKSGSSYVRGTVLGIASDTGEAVPVNSLATDGSEIPYAILQEDVDATDGAKPGTIYLTGEFNENALTFGGTDTSATHKLKLREIGIFLKNNQEA